MRTLAKSLLVILTLALTFDMGLAQRDPKDGGGERGGGRGKKIERVDHKAQRAVTYFLRNADCYELLKAKMTAEDAAAADQAIGMITRIEGAMKDLHAQMQAARKAGDREKFRALQAQIKELSQQIARARKALADILGKYQEDIRLIMVDCGKSANDRGDKGPRDPKDPNGGGGRDGEGGGKGDGGKGDGGNGDPNGGGKGDGGKGGDPGTGGNAILVVAPIIPNPIDTRNGAATVNLNYSIATDCPVTINVYDQNGNLVKTVTNETQTAGRYQISIDMQNLPAGVYVIEVLACKERNLQKLMLR